MGQYGANFFNFVGSLRWSTLTCRSLDTGSNANKLKYRQHLAFYSRHHSRQVFTSTSHNQQALDSLGLFFWFTAPSFPIAMLQRHTR
jgi:hypothetical protein